MATVTANASASLSALGSTTASGLISWNAPMIPDGAVISSVLLSGTWYWSGKGSITHVTINGTNTLPGTAFSIELGSGAVSPLQISCVGNKNATGNNFSWSGLTLTYTYTIPGQSTGIHVKVNGAYQEAKAVYMKKNGTYIEVTKEELQSLSGNYVFK